MPYLIVGIDTGKTSAIACIGLDGKPVKVKARIFAEQRWYVDEISMAGIPIVIASDKKNSSETVIKLATAFDAELYTPNEDISVAKKKEIARKYGIGNVHERDALTAALSAYNRHASKLNQAARLAGDASQEEKDRIKALVIKKHSVNEAMTGKSAGRFVR